MSGILGEYTEVFLEESEDQIEELNANLLKLESDHSNPEIINDIFRAAHSLKSSAAFVGLYNLSDLAHKMENLLQKIREDKITVQVQLVNLLFECFDLIKEVIDAVGQGQKIDTPFTDMIDKLQSYELSQEGGTTPATQTTASKTIVPTTPVASNSSETSSSVPSMGFLDLTETEQIALSGELQGTNSKAIDIKVKLKNDVPMKGSRYALILESSKHFGKVFKSIPDEDTLLKGGEISELRFLILSKTGNDNEIKKHIMSDMIESLDLVVRKNLHGPDFATLSLDHEEVLEIEEEAKIRGNATVYDVKITIKPDTQMKGLRFTLILQNLKQTSVVYKTDPELEVLERGIEQNSIVGVVISTMNEVELRRSMMVDMVDNIEIYPRKVASAITDAIESSSSSTSEKKGESQSTSQAIQKKEKVLPNTTIDKDAGGDKSISKSIKVSSEKLDQLMNNVGELVITNSGFQKIYDDLVRTFGDDTIFAELKSKIDQINRISKDLQSGIMNTRMVPIGTVFNRFSRLVRDLSVETGKKVNLVLLGENTELDKKVVDMIGEPLLHLIRNSIDHGIESPEERRKAGKPEIGTVELNAYQGGNNIMVEIKDDGKGLNKQRILKKAIENNLLGAGETQNLTDNDIYQFIFAPGFSTAQEITDISGRGVGMNVVNKLIQDFKGKILINTTEGFGTSFTLCFPQALAIIPSILVTMEEEVYAFPLSEVFETIRVKKDQINTLEGHEIINLRGEVLPIYRLNNIIKLAERKDVEEFPVVIVNFNNRKLGFIVDELIGKHETVIKTLEKNFRNIPGLTGASIMGDGTIILVLDIQGLIELTSTGGGNAGLDGKEMSRLNSNRTIDVTSTHLIFKTNNSTNMYNAKLLEMNLSDKSRKKKDKSQDKKKIAQPKVVEIVEEDLRPTVSFAEEEPTVSTEIVEEKATEVNEKTSVPEEIVEEQVPVAADPKIEDENLQAKELLKSLSEQTKSRVEQLIERPIDAMLSPTEIRKLESVVNTGMMNAGLVLSQLVGSNVELFMPEIMLTDKDGLVSEIREPSDEYFGLKIRMNGDLNGNLLMIFSEEKGKQVAAKLLKSNDTSADLAKKISEDSLSVLMEISNIVCASVINSLSNKAKSQIMPSVPELVTGSFREVLDIVKPEKTKFLCMNTEFIYEGDNMIGNLIFLPDFDELTVLIGKLT